MSIQNELNTIRNAVYGRDVRKAIAAGIEECYNDATTASPEHSIMEVSQARGTYESLGNRLNAMDNADNALRESIALEQTLRSDGDTALANQISALQGAVGSPLVAATAADMTDMTRIYVYTGSESGMTSGNWYYYDGSVWTSGGVYNAIAIDTDATLSVSGMAADAKRTGNAVDDLKTRISTNAGTDRNEYTLAMQTPTWEQGSIVSSSGAAGTSTIRIRTGSMPGSCDVLVIAIPSGYKVAVYGYVKALSSTQYVGRISDFVEPDARGYVCVPIDRGVSYALCVGYVDDSPITTDAADMITVYKAFLPSHSLETQMMNGVTSDSVRINGRFMSWERGTIRENGTPYVSNEYCIYTPNALPLNEVGSISPVSLTQTIAFACFYDASDTFITRHDLLAGETDVPYGAARVRFVYGNTTTSGAKVTNGLDLVNAFTVVMVKNTFSGYLEKIGLIRFRVRKGYWTNVGDINPNSTGVCANKLFTLPIGTKIRVIIPEDGWLYSVKQGSVSNNLRFTDRLVSYSEFEVTGNYIGIMFYKKDANGDFIDLDVSDFDDSVILFQEGYTTQRDIEMHDIPENIGVLNVINRAYQMAKLTYAPVANLPTQVNTEQYPGYIPAGETVEGVMYSSVRSEGLYVPQAVSLQAYMTALLNPNSYIYTKTEPSPHPNALTYYGAVCSSMVAWCYGIDDVIPTTVSFDTYPGMEIIEDQSPYGLKLGDMLNRSDVHIAIVTDIIRNNRGVISQIEVTDQVNNATNPMTRHRYLSPGAIQSVYFDSGYVAYRYHYIYKVPYTASPWINLDGETEEPVYSTNLSPRRGDQANWRSGETIEIDVLEAGEYGMYRLYKGETLLRTDTIPVDDVITFEGLSYGSYSVVLLNGTTESSPAVYFDIIDANAEYTDIGGGKVKVTYSSANASPSSVSFCEANSSDVDYKAVRAFHVLTDAEITAGEVTLDAPETGAWLMKVEYKAQYGLYSGDLTAVTVS